MTNMDDNTNPNCPYCQTALNPLGFEEHNDDLGTYIAETFICENCGYRLERNPVYLDGGFDGDFSTQIVD
jgi:C4-type Zn-finger protein